MGMEKITVEIKTVNSAFDGNEEHEVARILREFADKLENGSTPNSVLDINGNVVGKVTYK